jgi:UDP-GlcNAc3NAcA epimerase
MLRIYTVVGARPQFIKAAAVSRCIIQQFSDRVKETIIHTGQHFDHNMSKVFFEEMEIPSPAHELGIGGVSHAEMTGKMMIGLEKIFTNDQPDCVLVYGDTNSTLAASLTAAKMGIPVAHVEAGLRSFKKTMPEEINRRMTDHVSTFLFCPTDKAVENLNLEGFDGIFKNRPTPDKPLMLNVGDVMYDNVLFYHDKYSNNTNLQFGLEPNNYILCTIHRDFNTDNTTRFKEILEAIYALADIYKYKILIPVHPRTAEKMKQPEIQPLYSKLAGHANITLTEPFSYFENLSYLHNSRAVITDSGGLQKEAYFLRKPSVVLRSETEWQEIVDAGYAACADADKEDIINSTMKLLGFPLPGYNELYGDGEAAQNIVQSLTTFLK